MHLFSNDRWTASFAPTEVGRHVCAIEAWTDEFATWRRDFLVKRKAGQDTNLDALEGELLLASAQPASPVASELIAQARAAFARDQNPDHLVTDALAATMAESQLRRDLTRSQIFPLMIDRPRARASAWYEMVPRSQGHVPGRHGTFDDCIARLPDIAGARV